jgi:chromosome segregation ATPase
MDLKEASVPLQEALPQCLAVAVDLQAVQARLHECAGHWRDQNTRLTMEMETVQTRLQETTTQWQEASALSSRLASDVEGLQGRLQEAAGKWGEISAQSTRTARDGLATQASLQDAAGQWRETSAQTARLARDLQLVQSKLQESSGQWRETAAQGATAASQAIALQSKHAFLEEETSRKFREAGDQNAGLVNDVQLLKSRVWMITEVSAKLDAKVDVITWRETNMDQDAHMKTLRDITLEANSEFQAWRRHCDDRFALHYKDIRKLLVRAQFNDDD